MPEPKSNFPLHDFYADIHSTYDRVNRIFTFGQDLSWRKKAVEECLKEKPGSLLDVCTGTGDFILEVAGKVSRREGAVSLTGYDFSPDMLKEARRKQELLTGEGLASVSFVEGDVGQMPFADNSFDAMGITFGIRNLVYENTNAMKHLAELYRVLKPGGRFVVLESSKPGNILWRVFNNIYLRLILPYLGGIISGNLKAYRYLAKSSRNYYTISKMGGILEAAGFKIISGKSLFLGSVMLVVVKK
ncbi:MAG: ubiquinone/menaquinone biosynthesis methyltransferase [Bacteroidetes bacterium]|nr:ubiquinone/menaquinone biosynthesis methyltransferase [Bacteroidota bacterium]